MHPFDLIKLDDRVVVSAIFNTMRILKTLNPADTFYETYHGMYQRYQPYFDSYMLMWNIGAFVAPKTILEVGTRTGTSLCQLLSAYLEPHKVEKVVLIDPFMDGFSSPGIIFKNLQYLNLPYDRRVNMHVEMSGDFLPTLRGETFDYILVDGDHAKEAAKQDLDNVVPLCHPGSIIVFDDISTAPGECGLIDVWDQWVAENGEEFDCTHIMHGKGVAWAIKK